MSVSGNEAARPGLLRQGAGQPVVLLHGFCGAAAGWRPTVAGLAPGFDVIVPDWPGFGASAGQTPCTSIAEMAAWVVRLADELGLSSFHVIGHSMSGFVVQELLSSHAGRIGKAVLYGAGLASSREGRFESLQATIDGLHREGTVTTAERVCSTWFVEGRDDPAFAGSAQHGAAMNVEAAVAALRACELIDFSGRLSGIDNEVLIVIGDRDRTFRVADAVRLAAAFDDASLCVLPGCAHAAHLERPALFNLVVRGFLRGESWRG